MAELTHLDAQGQAHMVDVGAKADTEREAIAAGRVIMRPRSVVAAAHRQSAQRRRPGHRTRRGNHGGQAHLQLIPLCHPLLLTKVAVEFEFDEDASAVEITATVRCRGQTGVEMEALTAVSVAALTIYDMAKAVERGMTISDIRLFENAAARAGCGNGRRRMTESTRINVGVRAFAALPRGARLRLVDRERRARHGYRGADGAAQRASTPAPIWRLNGTAWRSIAAMRR